MIKSIQITGDNYDLDEATKKYVKKKIGQLDRYLPRHARASAQAIVLLRQVNNNHGNKFEAEVVLNAPDHSMTAKDSTINMIAAIDIVEAKIVSQLKKYKEKKILHIAKRNLLAKLKRS